MVKSVTNSEKLLKVRGGLFVMLMVFFTKVSYSYDKLLVVAQNIPPYEYEEGGVAKGINIEIISTIFTRLGIKYDIRFYPWSRAWLLVKKGEADVVSSISFKENRDPYIHYEESVKNYNYVSSAKVPYNTLRMCEYVIFMNPQYIKSINVKTFKELLSSDYRVGLLKGHNYNHQITSAVVRKVVCNSYEDAFCKLNNGEIDLFPCDKVVGCSIVNKLELNDKIKHSENSLYKEICTVGFSKKSNFPEIDKVRENFNLELSKMKASGEFDKIYSKYLKKGEKKRKLVFICEEWKPFEYVENGKPRGIDVEVVDNIMNKLGIPYEIKFYPWARAWLLIQKGKADAVLSISYKQSREKFLFYTPEQREFAKSGTLPKDYLWLSEYHFFIKKCNKEKLAFKSYSQIKRNNYRVGINKDYSYNFEFRNSEIKPALTVGKTEDGFSALILDKIDLYPMDRTIGLATALSMGVSESVDVLPKAMFSKPYLLPFIKKSDYPGLEKIMEKFYYQLNILRENGIYDRIYDKYTSEIKLDDK